MHIHNKFNVHNIQEILKFCKLTRAGGINFKRNLPKTFDRISKAYDTFIYAFLTLDENVHFVRNSINVVIIFSHHKMFWEPFVLLWRRLQGGSRSDLYDNVIDMCIWAFLIRHLRLACIFISTDYIIRGMCAVWMKKPILSKYILRQDISVEFWKIGNILQYYITNQTKFRIFVNAHF